jgi:PhnB protein
MSTNGIRPGFHSLTPYLRVADARKLIAFAKAAFQAEEIEVYEDGGRVVHAEIRIGDSIVELGEPGGQTPLAPVALHLYLPAVDDVYRRAIEAGATSMMAPADMPYGDREGDVKDAWGNHWYIATHLGISHVPENLRTVTISLRVVGVPKLVKFLQAAFDAAVLTDDGRYSQVRIGDSVIEPGEVQGEFGPMPMAIHYYVSDVDAVYARALEAGATSESAPADKPYGERGATVQDPFGNLWYLATSLG